MVPTPTVEFKEMISKKKAERDQALRHLSEYGPEGLFRIGEMMLCRLPTGKETSNVPLGAT